MDGVKSRENDSRFHVPSVSLNGTYPTGLSARLALAKAVRKQAYELRHAGYVIAGYIDPLHGGILRDEFDENTAARSIVLYKGITPAASVRICLLDLDSGNPDTYVVPASEMFHHEIMDLVNAASSAGRRARAVEVTKLARHPCFAKDNDLVFGIFRMTGYLILHHEADLVLISVCAHHVRFYKRLGYEVVAPPRNHPKFNAATGLMVCRRARFQDVCSSFPVMAGLSESDEIYGQFMQGDLVPVTLPTRTETVSPELGLSAPCSDKLILQAK